MAILDPTKLEEISYGQQGWDAIQRANINKINNILGSLQNLWDGTPPEGAAIIYQSGEWQAVVLPLGKVGELVAVPAGVNPENNTLLLCDGSTLSATDYPTLHAMVGATLPDIDGSSLGVDWYIRTG